MVTQTVIQLEIVQITNWKFVTNDLKPAPKPEF
jgi:hypothetical protein